MNELVDIWEGKMGKTLKRNYITEDELLKKIRDLLFLNRGSPGNNLSIPLWGRGKKCRILRIWSWFSYTLHSLKEIRHTSALTLLVIWKGRSYIHK
nr:uncharacterized protein LOC104092604 isoform X2 [Nicotiana tomentosiformis]